MNLFLESGLHGATVIVTGGSRGIGRAIVEVLAAEGADVTFTYLGREAAAEELIAAHPGLKIYAEKVDSRDSTACEALVEKVYDRTDRLDVLINNAGIIDDSPLTAMRPEQLRSVLETNIEGVFNMARVAAQFMISQRRGKIINLSSVSAEKGGRGQTNYAASKGAINAFTRALAVELAPRGITVNAVAPGVIETEMSGAVRERAADAILARVLLKRFGVPLDIARAVWFLSSTLSDYITGQILHVDGGFKME